MSTIRFGFSAQQIVDEGRTTWNEINLLKTWLKTEHLPKLTDEQIVLFLLTCINKQEPARATITANFRVKNGCPEIFDGRTTNRADVQKQLNAIEMCCLPEKTDEGYCLILNRLRDTYFGNFNLAVTDKLFTMTLDAALYDHPPTGLGMIIDLKGAHIMHLTKLRLGIAKTFLEYLQEGLPLKLKVIHIINTPYFIDKIMFLIKPFVTQEFIDLIIFHRPDMDRELFYKNYIPKSCLPEDYGGDLPSARILHQQNIDKLTSLEKYFQDEEFQRRGV